MKLYYDKTFRFIEEGKKGTNKGFSFTINQLNNYLRIWKGKYYLYFALSGVGKSKWVYDQHVFNVIDQQMKSNVVDKLHIDLYSLEISPITVTGHMIIHYLYKYKGIITDTDQIFSLQGKLNDDLSLIVNSKEVRDYIEESYKYITIYPHLSFTDLTKNTKEKLSEFGKIMTDDSGRIIDFEANCNFMYQVIIDHYSLTDLISTKNRYETIGIISKYLFKMRDITGITPIAIQQVKPDRTRKLEETVSPSHEDLRDSPETYNDSDVAVAIGDPFKHKIKVWQDYKIYPANTAYQGLQDRFKFIEIRKNRSGSGVNKAIPTLFIGECSSYNNIEIASKLTPDDYLKINNIKKTYQNNDNK